MTEFDDFVVLGSLWYGGCGIVRVMFKYDQEPKYKIRALPDGSGNSQSADEFYIAQWGSSFPKEAGDVLFNVR